MSSSNLPDPYLPTTYNPAYWSNSTTATSSGITQSQLNNALATKLSFPTAQGIETLFNGTIATTQTEGDNTTKLATTAFVQSAITTAAPSYSYTSVGASSNTWSFNLNNYSSPYAYGEEFDWFIVSAGGSSGNYTDNIGSSIISIPLSLFGSQYTNNGSPVQVVLNGFVCSGIGCAYPTTLNKSGITYWQGYQQQWNFSQSLYGYAWKINDTLSTSGQSLSLTGYVNNFAVSVPSSSPPSVSANSYNTMVIFSSLPINSNSVYLKLVIAPRPRTT